ncbi:peroxide stress protein YaaA [Streptococcus marimammalium]|uniref:peroxide stress protein YaaA n=1 Tax=Streptococcus marimammalium TaxID=269666 RepID=UPI0003786ECB|nr:peroxide stress protein YaaA [Streptococcus marimammalium]
MKFLIPTAKEMTEMIEKVTPAPINQKTKTIIAVLAKMTPGELAHFYKIKPEAAKKEWHRIQNMQNNKANYYPAISLFNGLMYRHINYLKFSASELEQMNSNVLITSSLYGIISALEPIAPHRLDFSQKLTIDGKSLKKYWQKDFDASINSTEIYISLLSKEFEDVFSKSIREQLTSVVFMESKKGQLKTHSTISKKGRGTFLATAIKQQAQELSDLKKLSFNGFSYRKDLSKSNKLVFVKEI